MRGKKARRLRLLCNVNTKENPTKYFHYNAEKASRKISADSSDPIIADSNRSIYQTSKRYFKLGVSIANIAKYLSEAAKERMQQGRA